MPDLEKRVASMMNVSEALRNKKRSTKQLAEAAIEDEGKKEEKREYRFSEAVKELLETEKRYIDDLKVIKH